MRKICSSWDGVEFHHLRSKTVGQSLDKMRQLLLALGLVSLFSPTPALPAPREPDHYIDRRWVSQHRPDILLLFYSLSGSSWVAAGPSSSCRTPSSPGPRTTETRTRSPSTRLYRRRSQETRLRWSKISGASSRASSQLLTLKLLQGELIFSWSFFFKL